MDYLDSIDKNNLLLIIFPFYLIFNTAQVKLPLHNLAVNLFLH